MSSSTARSTAPTTSSITSLMVAMIRSRRCNCSSRPSRTSCRRASTSPTKTATCSRASSTCSSGAWAVSEISRTLTPRRSFSDRTPSSSTRSLSTRPATRCVITSSDVFHPPMSTCASDSNCAAIPSSVCFNASTSARRPPTKACTALPVDSKSDWASRSMSPARARTPASAAPGFIEARRAATSS